MRTVGPFVISRRSLRASRKPPRLDPKLKALYKRLHSRNVEERKAAEQQMVGMGPDGLDAMIAITRFDVEGGFAVAQTMPLVAVFCLLLVLADAFFILKNAGTTSTEILVLAIVAELFFLCGVAVSIPAAKRVALESKVAGLVKLYGDELSIVGVLAEALEYGSASTRLDAERTLIRLLPHLEAREGNLLDRHQRDCLAGALSPQSRELTLTILETLGRIGDAADLREVERFHLRIIKTSAIHKLRPALDECASRLRSRIEQQRASEVLLRAADSVEPPAQILLRATPTPVDAAPDQLLRAGIATQAHKEL